MHVFNFVTMQESFAKIELYGLFLYVLMQFKKATVIMEGQGSFI